MRHVWPILIALFSVVLSGACFSAAGVGSPIQSFTAERPKVSKGTTGRLTAVFDNGNASIDNGVGSVASGEPIETPPLERNTVYTLTVVLDSGETHQSSVEVQALDLPVINSFKQDKVVRAGEESSVTAVFTGGKGDLLGFGEIVSGVPKPIGKLDVTKNLTVKVTSETGDSVSADAEVEAAVTPVIQSFTAEGTVVSRFAPMNLTATFTGGKGQVDQNVGPIVSGTPAPTPKVPMGGGTYTLTVTNGLGESVKRSLSVTTKKELFVTDYNGNVVVYDWDARGDVPPKRTLTTGADGTVGMSIVNGELFVAGENAPPSLSVFSIDAEGTATPKRKIVGAATTWAGDVGAYMFSAAGTEIFMADKSNAIKVWNITDNGNVAPKRTIAGAATGLNNAISTFVSGGEIFVSNYAFGGAGTVTVYNQAATGNVASKRTFNATTPTSLLVDGNELYVSSKDMSVTVYNKTTRAQLRRITGALTEMTEIHQCAIADAELACPSFLNDKILVYPANATGNVAPKRSIGGAATQLSMPGGVVVY